MFERSSFMRIPLGSNVEILISEINFQNKSLKKKCLFFLPFEYFGCYSLG